MSDIREQYDALAVASDTEYKLAGIAMRQGDYNGYKLHVDRSWAILDEAKLIWEQLSETDRRELKNNALVGMARAFVGLGR